MLPNHSPLVILYPGRIDLALGRAPGTDQRALLALRRNLASAETFPDDVLELQQFFEPAKQGQAIHGAGCWPQSTTLDSRFQFVRCAARSRVGIAGCSAAMWFREYSAAFGPNHQHRWTNPRVKLGCCPRL
jgi:alkanesulfonate monooxygenase SsuD/methylene tetrahydromethanopterin reductase-like flavin-dependent oxidoreductase (luciferase family)